MVLVTRIDFDNIVGNSNTIQNNFKYLHRHHETKKCERTGTRWYWVGYRKSANKTIMEQSMKTKVAKKETSVACQKSVTRSAVVQQPMESTCEIMLTWWAFANSNCGPIGTTVYHNVGSIKATRQYSYTLDQGTHWSLHEDELSQTSLYCEHIQCDQGWADKKTLTHFAARCHKARFL